VVTKGEREREGDGDKGGRREGEMVAAAWSVHSAAGSAESGAPRKRAVEGPSTVGVRTSWTGRELSAEKVRARGNERAVSVLVSARRAVRAAARRSVMCCAAGAITRPKRRWWSRKAGACAE
jgi:hypothetical protein